MNYRKCSQPINLQCFNWRRGSESNIILFRSKTVATPGRISLCARSSMFASLSKGFPDLKNYFGNAVYYL